MQASETMQPQSIIQTQSTCSPLNAIYVWEKMQEIFGNSWSNQYSMTPNSTWIAELSQLSEIEITRGLNAVLKSRAKYVPNLATFLGMCELVDDRTPEQRAFDARVKENSKMLALPKPPPNPEIRKAEIAKMKAALRGAA